MSYLKSKPTLDSHLEKIPASNRLSRFLVRDSAACPVGIVEKFHDDNSTINPWKAYRGIGVSCKYLRSFYDEEGGRDSAIAAVLKGVA